MNFGIFGWPNGGRYEPRQALVFAKANNHPRIVLPVPAGWWGFEIELYALTLSANDALQLRFSLNSGASFVNSAAHSYFADADGPTGGDVSFSSAVGDGIRFANAVVGASRGVTGLIRLGDMRAAGQVKSCSFSLEWNGTGDVLVSAHGGGAANIATLNAGIVNAIEIAPPTASTLLKSGRVVLTGYRE